MSPAPTTSITALIAGETFSLLVGLYPNVDVTRLDAMVFRVRKRDKKRQNSQYCNCKPHHK